jgi:hypothetical protein
MLSSILRFYPVVRHNAFERSYIKSACNIYPNRQGKEQAMENADTAYSYKELYTELENYEKNGVCMLMDGSKASPMQIVTAHMVREEGSYMRDYILDPEGYIKSLIFVNINENNENHFEN